MAVDREARRDAERMGKVTRRKFVKWMFAILGLGVAGGLGYKGILWGLSEADKKPRLSGRYLLL